jgi:uncharacterized protein (TIGR00730 family)
MKVIAVYGSSATQPGDADYESSLVVGRALAEAGFSVMTGGYAGVMEAASRGAHEAGGHVIGVTTDAIEAFRGGDLRPNQWVVDEVRHATLRERVAHLILHADAYVIMPGGLGTLHELVSVWELMRVGDIPQRPIICYGQYWREMLRSLIDSPYISPTYWEILTFVDTPAQMIEALKPG